MIHYFKNRKLNSLELQGCNDLKYYLYNRFWDDEIISEPEIKDYCMTQKEYPENEVDDALFYMVNSGILVKIEINQDIIKKIKSLQNLI